MMETYDLIVVGAGPGGYVAAERAGALGKRVLLIERDQFGGVCTNRGCIPTKSLLHAAKLYMHAREAGRFGVHCGTVDFNIAEAMAWKMETIGTLRNGIEFLMKSNKVEVVFGEASYLDNHHVVVGGTTYGCTYLIIATGSSPAVPPIPGHDLPNVVTSDGILEIDHIPASLAVIGGGVIGMEFASFFSMIGCKVTVIEMMPEVLPMMDGEFAKLMRREMKDVDFHLSCKVEAITANTVEYTDAKAVHQSLEAQMVLLSVGRRANTRGLEPLALVIDRSGVVVDDTCRTNVPNIYAIGDVNGKSQLAHSASRMADVAISNMFGNGGQKMRYHAIPWAVYGVPEAAGCGLNEQDAARKGIKVVCATTQMRANGRFLAENGKRAAGLCKVVADAATNVILGVHLLGPYSSEMIWGVSTIIESELRIKDVKEIVFPHPSVSEIIKDTVFAIDHTL